MNKLSKSEMMEMMRKYNARSIHLERMAMDLPF